MAVHPGPPPAGLAAEPASDDKAYTSLLYGNGPGFALDGGSRPNVSDSQSGERAAWAGRGAWGGLPWGGHGEGRGRGWPPLGAPPR